MTKADSTVGLNTGALAYLLRNPELGPVRIDDGVGGRLKVRPLRGEVRETILVDPTELRPFPLYEGLPVHVVPQEPAAAPWTARLLSVDAGGVLRRGLVKLDGVEAWVEESRVVPLASESKDPLGLLENAEYRSPRRFFARRDLRNTLYELHRDSEGIPTLFGARVRPLAHQLYAVRRILWNRAPRFVLADEVGLGKTIEAGYVIQALTAADPNCSVLVITPGAMARQWLCELYLRFGARVFTDLSAPRWEKANTSERQSLAQQKWLIVSTTALEGHEDLRALLADREWGLVVVDEAHQVPPRHPLYPWLRALAERAHGILALSATPSKRETGGLLGLLALVSPDVYSPEDTAALQHRLDAKKRIWDALAYSTELLDATRQAGEELDEGAIASIAEYWQGVASDDPVFQKLLEQFRSGEGEEALDQLIGYVQEFHRIDHRLIRTRRATLAVLELPQNPRVSQVAKYEATAVEKLLAERLDQLPASPGMTAEQWALRGLYQRFACTNPEHFLAFLLARKKALGDAMRPSPPGLARALRSDPGADEETLLIQRLIATTPPLPGEDSWRTKAEGLVEEWVEEGPCARYRWAVEWLRARLAEDPARKILVFSQDRENVEDFGMYLHQQLPQAGMRLFHHRLSPQEIEEAAWRFQADPKCRVLISDELGGEGRNFEIAWAVMHLDVPASVARLEQRIGRLDRVGRPPDHPIHTVLLHGPNRTEQLLVQLHTEVFQVQDRSIGGLEFDLPRLQQSVSDAACGKDTEGVTERLRAEIARRLAETDKEFETSLDSSRPELDRAREFAEILDETEPESAHKALIAWSRALGFRDDGIGNGLVQLQWEQEQLEERLSGIGRAERVAGTFTRKRALEDNRVQFFAPGHRLVDTLVDALDTTPIGRATIFRRSGLGPQNRNQFFLVALVRSVLRGAIPAGLLVRARSELWPRIEQVVLKIDPRNEEEPVEVTDAALRERLLAPYRGRELDPKVEHEELSAFAAPNLWAATRGGVARALEIARATIKDDHEMVAQELEAALQHELGYYQSVSERENPAEAVRARAELDVRKALVDSVRQATVELDALALVLGA
ncbi:SNF2-related protein [Myxococcus sp. AM010]|uniref:SNF2-related protein n=1 Tax=Myxococcus sp. AM010 TaxID=2745138 RepID=UPI00159586CF|nr:helicase-related protein [Myxococcus sp. AM010]NVJ15312.1 DEAD/DEAH box helicase family protein [Myxococcus sp. AM010]